ncbi:DUF2293 domain-containing protein [Halosquirtibacter laminarini]|uniref:DUF2293 domain-containing protein n=1 Tax=Halosquirtibacter laminarini TaxID=3374600 RepID=A0AC61NHQ2_9BACT|nr:DUF2293 domain-containing protein [Prolixibacteraceae bacterium]
MQIEVTKQSDGKYIDSENRIIEIPSGWTFLPAGDAGITRNVTKQAQYIRWKKKKGKRWISQGLWAPSEIVEVAQQKMLQLRNSNNYALQKEKRLQRRDHQHSLFCGELKVEIIKILSFHKRYAALQERAAEAITKHTAPIGSGTAARSSSLNTSQKAQRAINGWIRHHLTNYDNTPVARIKGERTKLRKRMIEEGEKVLNIYREGKDAPNPCPIEMALKK